MCILLMFMEYCYQGFLDNYFEWLFIGYFGLEEGLDLL